MGAIGSAVDAGAAAVSAIDGAALPEVALTEGVAIFVFPSSICT